MAKILLFDIEASSLKASFGITLAFGYKWYGEDEAHVLAINDYSRYKKDRVDDSVLLKEAAKLLTEADMWVTWYGSQYDVPFLQTRMLYHKLGVLPGTPHVDLLFQSRSKLKMHSNRLAAVADFFGLPSKTPVVGDHWVRAIAGYADSMKYIVDHCKGDVETLEAAYELYRPMIRTHPRVAGWLPCRVCGSSKLQRRGNVLTVTKGERFRVRCSNCGAWETRSTLHTEASVMKRGEKLVTTA